MSAIEFEDRTNESPVAAVTRQVEAVSQVLIKTTVMASQGNPAIGLGALALSLGQGAARTGAKLDEVLAAVQRAYEAGMLEQAEISSSISDA
jgi:hypothetical protein